MAAFESFIMYDPKVSFLQKSNRSDFMVVLWKFVDFGVWLTLSIFGIFKSSAMLHPLLIIFTRILVNKSVK